MFFKSVETNRKNLNFSEYALKSSENQRFSSPKFFATQKSLISIKEDSKNDKEKNNGARQKIHRK